MVSLKKHKEKGILSEREYQMQKIIKKKIKLPKIMPPKGYNPFRDL